MMLQAEQQPIMREFITGMVSKAVNTKYSLQSQNLVTMGNAVNSQPSEE
jgi:hypothetical protein